MTIADTYLENYLTFSLGMTLWLKYEVTGDEPPKKRAGDRGPAFKETWHLIPRTVGNHGGV